VVNATDGAISHNDLVTSNPPLVRLLTRSQVRSLLRWPELIEAIAQALIDASGGESAAAARELAGPGPQRLALLGAGPVARQSLAALSQAVELQQVRVWSRDQGRSEEFSNETTATAVGSVKQAVAGADIILTATPAREPLVTGADLADHALVLAMGADTRGKRELGDGVLDGAELVADVPADAAAVALILATAEHEQAGTLLDFAG
jgi:ornithine cyclodeaminase/alanine dehydrogenase-like protein (mu-crystallin family)